MTKKILLILALTLTLSTAKAYESVDCSINPLFGQNNCNECFDWGEVKTWDNVTMLDDLWKNETTNDKLMYSEEITYPKMMSVEWASFEQKPADNEEFWETTSDLEALYSTWYEAYVLPAGQNVTWLRGKLGSAYQFTNNSLNVWDTAWVLVFDIMSHDIVWEDISMSETPHKECVAYVNASEIVEVTPVVEEPTPEPQPEEMTKVETGPWMNLILIIALSILLWVGLLNRKLVLEKIKK